jgi:hypothetical protein
MRFDIHMDPDSLFLLQQALAIGMLAHTAEQLQGKKRNHEK